MLEQREIVDAKFMASMADKQPFIKKMFTVFIAQEPKRIREIKDALASGDAKQLRLLAHALKGGAATLGVSQVRDRCLALENAAKVDDLPAAEAEVVELEKEIRRAYAFMFNYLAEN